MKLFSQLLKWYIVICTDKSSISNELYKSNIASIIIYHFSIFKKDNKQFCEPNILSLVRSKKLPLMARSKGFFGGVEF